MMNYNDLDNQSLYRLDAASTYSYSNSAYETQSVLSQQTQPKNDKIEEINFEDLSSQSFKEEDEFEGMLEDLKEISGSMDLNQKRPDWACRYVDSTLRDDLVCCAMSLTLRGISYGVP
jgi:hypothetical protein